MNKATRKTGIAKAIVWVTLAAVTIEFHLNRFQFMFAVVPALFIILVIDGDKPSIRGGLRMFVASSVLFIVGYGIAFLFGYSFVDIFGDYTVNYLIRSIPWIGIVGALLGLIQILIGLATGQYEDIDDV